MRIGLHTGEPGLGDEGYLGLDVVRAARICAAAHGGQVLLSSATNGLLAGDPVEGLGTIDLGEHHLRGLPRPVGIHQLVLAGLQTRFEPHRVERQPEERAVLHGRHVEDVVRELRTSIEQRVSDSLRTAHERPRRVRYEIEGSASLSRILGIALAAVAATGATIGLVVWLLVR